MRLEWAANAWKNKVVRRPSRNERPIKAWRLGEAARFIVISTSRGVLYWELARRMLERRVRTMNEGVMRVSAVNASDVDHHSRKPLAVLVTGGAGYIGSHTCKALAHAGYMPVVLDDLSAGHRWAVKWGPLIVGDI